MMQFVGQVVVAGSGSGEAVVTDVPLSLWGGLDPASGEVIDRRHPLSGVCLTGRVLVVPHGRGSCSASGVLLEAIRNSTAPAAILTTRIDPIIGLGAILGDELYRRPVPVVVIEPADAAAVVTGDRVEVRIDGTVMIAPRGERLTDGTARRLPAKQ
jgi:hypothetical protein